jgi:hypothetical protein
MRSSTSAALGLVEPSLLKAIPNSANSDLTAWSAWSAAGCWT